MVFTRHAVLVRLRLFRRPAPQSYRRRAVAAAPLIVEPRFLVETKTGTVVTQDVDDEKLAHELDCLRSGKKFES